MPILIVEDDDEVREALSDLLASEGYRVACARHGGEALDCLSGGLTPCLILLDLMMPVMDGWEFLRRRRTLDGLGAVPVVVLSAALRPQLPIDETLLRKPVDLDALLDHVRRHCPEAC